MSKFESFVVIPINACKRFICKIMDFAWWHGVLLRATNTWVLMGPTSFTCWYGEYIISVFFCWGYCNWNFSDFSPWFAHIKSFQKKTYGALHPGKLTWNLKRDYFNRKYIFQPLIFRCYVSFPGSTMCFSKRNLLLQGLQVPCEQREPNPWADMNHEILIGSWRDPYIGLWNNPRIIG